MPQRVRHHKVKPVLQPTDVWLSVGLTLLVMVVLLSAAVVVYCRKRFSGSKGEATGNTQRPSSDRK